MLLQIWSEVVWFINELITFIGNAYPNGKAIYNTIGAIISAMLFYKTFYWIIVFFTTRKFKPAKNKHKYAIMIAARNEENVIGRYTTYVAIFKKVTWKPIPHESKVTIDDLKK